MQELAPCRDLYYPAAEGSRWLEAQEGALSPCKGMLWSCNAAEQWELRGLVWSLFQDHTAAVSAAPFPRLGTSPLQKKPQQHHSVLTALMDELCLTNARLSVTQTL